MFDRLRKTLKGVKNWFIEFLPEHMIVGSVMLATIACIAMASANQTSRFDTGNDDVVTVTVDGGGDIMKYYQHYTDMRLNNQKLRIEGLCASACTFFLNTVPPEDVCATQYAHFGFHDIYIVFMGMLVPRYDTYAWFSKLVYPDWVLDKLVTEYGFDGTKADVDKEKYPGGLIWMDRDDLRIQHCED